MIEVLLDTEKNVATLSMSTSSGMQGTLIHWRLVGSIPRYAGVLQYGHVV